MLVQSVTPIGPYLHLEQTRAYAVPGFISRIGVTLEKKGNSANRRVVVHDDLRLHSFLFDF